MKRSSVLLEQIFQQYHFEYDSIMRNAEAKQCFAHYLRKVELSEESLLFLQQVEAFQQGILCENLFLTSVQDRTMNFLQQFEALIRSIFETADKIMNQFILRESPNEVNLPGDLRDRMVQHMTQLRLHVETKCRLLESEIAQQQATTQVSLTELRSMLHDSFTPVCNYINFLLKFDSFARFLRSSFWKDYVLSHPTGELDKLAVDSKVKLNNFLLLKREDFSDCQITPSFIEYIKLQCFQDSNHWKLNYASEDGFITLYSSSRNFFLGDQSVLPPEMQYMTLFKNTYYFNATPKEVILLCQGKETQFENDVNLRSCNKIEYVPISATQPFALSITSHTLDFGPFLQKRFSSFVWTMLYDQQTEQVMILCKSCDHPKSILPKNHLKLNMIVGIIIKKMSNDVTRMVTFQQVNLGGFFKKKSKFNETASIQIAKKRTIARYNEYCQQLKKFRAMPINQNSGFSGLEQIVTDSLGVFETFKENLQSTSIPVTTIDPSFLQLKHTNFSI